MLCARAFGACVTMRDEPIGKRPPERLEPQTKYHDERLEEALQTLVELKDLNDSDKAVKASNYNQERAASHQEYQDRQAKHEARYRMMLDKVQAWQVPESLTEFKKFMVEQLAGSIDFDCGHRSEPPEPLLRDQWYTMSLQKAARDVEYHAKEREEEIRRTEERNQWLAELRAALSPERDGE